MKCTEKDPLRSLQNPRVIFEFADFLDQEGLLPSLVNTQNQVVKKTKTETDYKTFKKRYYKPK